MKMRKYLAILLVCAPLLCVCPQAFAILINFDDQGLIGPSTFAAAGTVQTLSLTNVGGSGINATFTGGVILTNATNAPADETSIYGTAYFADPSLSSTLTITFSQSVTNFFMDLYNGLTTDRTYTASDNSGNSTTVTLAPNFSSGQSLIAFAATGTVITITDVTEADSVWDFAIDNIHFDEPLPGQVPEPSTLMLIGGGLLGLAGLRRKFRKN